MVRFEHLSHVINSSYFQGANTSALEKEISNDQQLSNEHFYGLVNVSVFGVDRNINTFIAVR